MKILIPLTADSYNTYPKDDLIIEVYGEDGVALTVDDGSARTVSVSREQLLKAIKALEN